MLTKSKPVHTPIKLTRFITALHEMQTRGIAMRKLSVCPSVCQTRKLWQNGRTICPYERSFSL